MHPYEMRRLIRHPAKDEHIDLKPGSLYRTIEQLERTGMVEQTERSGRGGSPIAPSTPSPRPAATSSRNGCARCCPHCIPLILAVGTTLLSGHLRHQPGTPAAP